MGVHRDLAAALGPDQPFYAIHARGFDGAAPPCATVGDMVAAYLEEIRQVWPDGPCIIGGICDGCAVAMEMAQELAAADRTVAPLLLIDPVLKHPRPGGPRPAPGALPPAALAQIRQQAESALRSIGERYAYVPYAAADPRQLARAVDVAVATCLALARYRPQPYYGPTELIVSAERAGQFLDPGHPWQETLHGRRTVHVLAGGHFDLMLEEQERIRWLIHAFLQTALAPQASEAPVPAAMSR
jgi:thioesterase domain-containing protein